MSSRICGTLLAPVFPRKEAVPRLEARAAGFQRSGTLRHAREREIADRNHVCDIGRTGMAAAIAERVKLLDIADAQARLRLDPFAQPDLERAMRQRIERTERQAGARFGFSTVSRHQDRRLAVLHRDDCRGQPDFDRREDGFGHRYSRSSRKGSVAYAAMPGPIDSIAATMRPLRPSIGRRAARCAGSASPYARPRAARAQCSIHRGAD